MPAPQPLTEDSSHQTFHTTALTLWLVSVFLPGLLTRNPFYLLLSLGLLGFVHHRLARRSPTTAAWGSVLRLSLFFVLFTLAFNLLLGGYGETTLFELPAWKVEGEGGRTVFQIGGAVTLESLLYGLTTALVLTVMLVAVSIFNALVDHYQLLRGLPRVLYQAATVVSIAITFVPELFRAQKEIREALALRGHRFRGFRDLLPLLLNLVAEALERAMALAESMEARGFSGPPLSSGERRGPRIAVALGLAIVLAGWLLKGLWERPVLGFLLICGGCALLALTLWHLGRRVERSRHRRQIWQHRDRALALVSTLAVVWWLGLFGFERSLFAFHLLPRVAWPPFEPQVALPLFLILSPVLLATEMHEA